MSRELGKDKSTIVEHLEILKRAGLVERMERKGHKWVFYGLSKNGQAFFPNKRKRIIFIVVAALSAIGAMLSLFAYTSAESGGPQIYAEAAREMKLETAQEAAVAVAAGTPDDIYFYAGVALATLFLVSVVQFLLLKGNELVVPRRKK